MKKCPYCAEEIQDEAIFCKHCKKNLVTQNNQGNNIAVVFAVLAIAVLVVFFALGPTWGIVTLVMAAIGLVATVARKPQ